MLRHSLDDEAWLARLIRVFEHSKMNVLDLAAIDLFSAHARSPLPVRDRLDAPTVEEGNALQRLGIVDGDTEPNGVDERDDGRGIFRARIMAAASHMRGRTDQARICGGN